MSAASPRTTTANGSANSPDDSFFVQVMEEYLSRLEAGEPPDRHELLKQFPDHAETLGEFLDGLDLVHQLAPQLCDSPMGLARQGSEPVALGDFRIIREINRGGMGVVYEAEQLSLGRRVALKVLPYAAVLDQKQLLRFKNEAQAAAQLRHANIVGVHFVGCDRGVHYYAMELIDGKSLSELISDQRQAAECPQELDYARTSTPQEALNDETRPVAELSTVPSIPSREQFRAVTRLGIQAAKALEYAHAAGVVHRDIKPSNLLVDALGHLRVTDFGLAMTQTDTRLTLTGDLLGTLRYMSPEQAVGNHTQLDHRADIYSLGVTLYELLTLRVPFDSQDRQKLLRDIIEREPRPLRQIRSGVPKDLETIVLKAMAKEPVDRYRDARDLADDLQRFLNDEPIQARRPGVTRRLSKWSLRYKTPLIIGAAVLCVMATIGAVLLWQQRGRTLVALAQARQNYQTAEAQRLETERQRQLAEANFRREQNTVEELLMRMAINLSDVPHTEHVQGALLDHALAYYLRFLHERPDDPSVRFDTAQAYFRIADIAERVVRRAQQERACLESVALMTRLVHEFPDDPRYGEALARAHERLGRCSYAHGRIEEAEAEHRKALAISKTLANRLDSNGIYRRALAQNHTDLGFTLSSPHNDLKRFEEGLTELRRGLLLWEELVREFDLVEYGADLAHCHRLLGKRLRTVGRTSEAEPHLDKAAALLTRLSTDFPATANLRFSLADALDDLGMLYLRTGCPEPAANALERCVKVRSRNASDFPAFYKQRQHLGNSYGLLGEALIQSGKSQESELALRKSLAIKEQLHDELGSKDVGRGDISWCHHGLALILQATGRPEDAEREFRQTIKIREELVHDYPLRASFHRYLAWGKYELGILLSELKRNDEAGELFQGTLAIFAKLMADDAPSSRIRTWFTSFLANCPDERYRDAQRAIELSRKLLEEIPRSAEIWNLLGLASYRAGHWDDAIEAFNKSTELRSAGEKLQPCHEWLFLAAAHWRLGHQEEGRQWYDRTMAWITDNGINEQYNDLRRWLPEVSAIITGRMKNDSSSQFSCSQSRKTLGTCANAPTLTDQPAVGAPVTTASRLTQNWEVLNDKDRWRSVAVFTLPRIMQARRARRPR